MNITVSVDEVTLETVVGKVMAFTEDGDEYETGTGKTVADLVADRIVDRAVNREGWQRLADQVREIRAEVIRELVRPQIEAAIAKPVQKTNSYGDKVGEPVTLTELIIDEARKALRAPADSYNRGGETVIGKAVAEAVKKAFAAEIAAEVAKARALVSDEIGKHVAAAVQAGLKAR